MNPLHLDKPLIFFDLESTGTDTRRDRIVELSTIKITPDGKQEIITQRFNPGRSIPEQATAVHGIKDEDVINEPSFSEKAQEIHDYFLGCDFAGYNILTFDIRMLKEEFLRAGLEPPFNKETRIIDGMRIFHKMEPRDLAAAYKFYCDKEMIHAHQAEADTLAAMEVLEGQIARYGLQSDVAVLADLSKYDKDSVQLDFAGKFIRDSNGEIVFNFGKDHKGKKVLENLGMLKWMLDKDFELHTLHIAKLIVEGKIK
jgi:DNA polymerase III subunit epsilon